MVIVRKAVKEDLNGFLKIYREARDKFKKEGTFQWKDGYPNEEIFYDDLHNNHLVCAVCDGALCGIMTIQESLDYNYEDCDTVKWLNGDKYICIHRIAVSKDFLKMGVGSKLIEYAVNYSRNCKVNNIKVDTHEKNYDMKKLIGKFGFVYCGVILLHEKNELRDAYQREEK